MKKIYHNNYFSELKTIASKINSLYPNWEEIPAKEKLSLINRLTKYYNRVKNKYSKRSLVKVLGVASIFISSIGFSQTFTTPLTQPFSINNNSAYNFSNAFVDIDNDGDLDLFTSGDYLYYGHNLYYQENTGTASSPSFGTIQTNPFSFLPGTQGYTYMTDFNFADIDNDGDFDLFVIDSYNDDLRYYENKGTSTVPLFDSVVTNPFGTSIIQGDIADIADIDGDGDFDIITMNIDFGSSPVLNYKVYENTGTSLVPLFSTAGVSNPYGILAPTNGYGLLDFVDFDGDGDLDLFQSQHSTGNKIYQENTGTATAPVFAAAQTNPFNLSVTTKNRAPEMVDIDNDGDIDMFVTVSYGSTIYFENNSPPVLYQPVSIYEIQYTAATSGDSPYNDSLVETTGIVTAKHSNGYWIQDSVSTWNGIYVFDNTNTPSLGDKVRVRAEVDEFFNLTELKSVDTLITISSGNTLPTPISINTTELSSEEKYEGVLIKTSSVTCVNPSAGNGEWLILSTTDTAVVDDLIYAYTPLMGSVYDITGVGHYGFGDYKIEPRDSSDIVLISSVSLNENQELTFNLFPNPVNNQLTVSGENLTKAEIYTIGGKLVQTVSLQTNQTIDVSKLESGIYIVRVTSENKVGVSRFVKEQKK